MIDFQGDESFISNHRQVLVGESQDPIHLLEYRPEFYHSQTYAQFEIEKPKLLSQWIPKRQAQFLAGRVAAKQALSLNSIQVMPKHVGIGNTREPIWPAAFLGSISHTGHTSIASVCKKNKTPAGLGIDIQETISQQLQSQISSTVLTYNDCQWFTKRLNHFHKSLLFTLIFSAKESFFKAAFISVGQYFDFIDVSIIAIDTEKQQLTLKTNKNLSPEIKNGFEANIAYSLPELSSNRVITACHWEL